MSYTYLMAWFALHCPVPIQLGEEAPEGVRFAYLHHFENSQWEGKYFVGIRRLVKRQDSYSLFLCFPHILGTQYGEKVRDVGDDRSSLGEGTFKWLISIMPSHLVYRCGDVCHLEPYLPSRFDRQFGYENLYIGNPHPQLEYMGSLIDGARAWSHFITGCTRADFASHTGLLIFLQASIFASGTKCPMRVQSKFYWN